jgi:hypothetical protein
METPGISIHRTCNWCGKNYTIGSSDALNEIDFCSRECELKDAEYKE